MSRLRWARGLVVAGLILMVVPLAVDPLEGSIVTVPGIGAVAGAAFLMHSRSRAQAYWAVALLVLGMGAMLILGAGGGIGGDTGRSMWWGVLLVPLLVGWLLGLLAGIRLLREVIRPAAMA